MSALTTIGLSTIGAKLVTSSATVGIDKTYFPEGWRQGNLATWVDRSGGVALGFPRITFGFRPPSKDNRVYRMSQKLVVPTLETIDPAVGIFGPKLGYACEGNIGVTIHERATSAERIAFLSLLFSSLAATIEANDAVPTGATGSPLVTGILNLEDVY